MNFSDERRGYLQNKLVDLTSDVILAQRFISLVLGSADLQSLEALVDELEKYNRSSERIRDEAVVDQLRAQYRDEARRKDPR